LLRHVALLPVVGELDLAVLPFLSLTLETEIEGVAPWRLALMG
jgi:hypothetical protein